METDDLLDLWLKAEDGGDDAAAEAALTALFAVLPARAPAPGFADRVLAAAAPARRGERAGGWSRVRARLAALVPAALGSPWGRPAVALGLVAAALGLPLFSGALVSLVSAVRPALLAPAAADALVMATGWVASSLRLGRWLAAFAGTLLTPLESPAVAALLGACLLVPALALRLLHDLIQRERNWTHANPF